MVRDKNGLGLAVRGDPVYEGLTSALEAVMRKGAIAAEGGGYVVVRHTGKLSNRPEVEVAA